VTVHRTTVVAIVAMVVGVAVGRATLREAPNFAASSSLAGEQIASCLSFRPPTESAAAPVPGPSPRAVASGEAQQRPRSILPPPRWR
jgi:hypothetical protein